tara:strand:- start:842 stop:1609 length:768 start_codon:yes stop_codon:yes gene_type:complete
LSTLKKNVKLFAKLLQSVGRQGRGTQKQPLSPLATSQYIKQYMDEEKLDKIQVSERLGLGRQENLADMYKKTDSTQVGLFLKLLEVSPKSRDVAGWGWEDPPKINFTTICRLAKLSHDEQDTVLRSVYRSEKKQLRSQDAIKLVQYRDENPDLPIDEVIDKILKLKASQETSYMIVCEIHEKLKKFIENNNDYEEKLLKILDNSIEGTFYEINASEAVIAILLDQKAFTIFDREQEKNGNPYTEYLNKILEDKID